MSGRLDKQIDFGERDSSLDIDKDLADELGQKFLELAMEQFTNIRDLPVFPTTDAAALKLEFDPVMPLEGVDPQKLLVECQSIIKGSRQNGHPRFFGYVASPATFPGICADFLASALNQNVTSWRSAPSATEIERIVIKWLGELTGFGSNCAGILTSGGSMANLNALTMAHRVKCEADVSREGIRNSGRTMTIFATDQTHHSVLKAADLIGLGRNQVRIVDTDDRFRMDVRALRQQIEADKAGGFHPFCVVATAGTVNTGAVDPLAAIAEIAREHRMWLHVDGAYGGPAATDKSKQLLFDGIGIADSMSIDAHKWLYSPVDCGCLLFRDAKDARRAFSESSEADYIKVYEQQQDEAFAFWDYGTELSRRFRALKLWMMMKYFGVRRIAEAIAEDCRLASYMAECVQASDDFELLAPVELSICCFRYVPPHVRKSAFGGGDKTKTTLRLNNLNAAIMHSIQRGGRAYLSNANLRGQFALRACIVNFRTKRSDIDFTLDLVRETAAGLI
ncbi:MAG: aromatic-L-amino-acid/L-tryptophan decarboxylase [Blastocatellia bacterium]|jgi:glutamate/tyrosine decarboxylase-like PLP-dependent enzyme|nr:aromatic-L-amino-acid/L-tryptophan decarboxylase [Blastocatellia bacterium]